MTWLLAILLFDNILFANEVFEEILVLFSSVTKSPLNSVLSKLFILSEIFFIYSGVVPQHPPIIDTPNLTNFSTHIKNSSEFIYILLYYQ